MPCTSSSIILQFSQSNLIQLILNCFIEINAKLHARPNRTNIYRNSYGFPVLMSRFMCFKIDSSYFQTMAFGMFQRALICIRAVPCSASSVDVKRHCLIMSDSISKYIARLMILRPKKKFPRILLIFICIKIMAVYIRILVVINH